MLSQQEVRRHRQMLNEVNGTLIQARNEVEEAKKRVKEAEDYVHDLITHRDEVKGALELSGVSEEQKVMEFWQQHCLVFQALVMALGGSANCRVEGMNLDSDWPVIRLYLPHVAKPITLRGLKRWMHPSIKLHIPTATEPIRDFESVEETSERICEFIDACYQ